MDHSRRTDSKIRTLALLSGALLLKGATMAGATGGETDALILAATQVSAPNMKERVDAAVARMHQELLDETRAALRAMEQPAPPRPARLMLSEADPVRLD